MCGHGTAFGPFVAQELLWRLATSSFSRLEHLNLGFDALGDDGAVAVALAIGKIPRLVTIDLSGNAIGQRGATAIYEALCHLPAGARLQSVRMDDNQQVSPQLLAAISMQALANNLAAIVDAARAAPRDAAADADAAAVSPMQSGSGAGDHPLEQIGEGMRLPAWPAVRLDEVWLAQLHVTPLRTLFSATADDRPPSAPFTSPSARGSTLHAIANVFAVPKPPSAGGGAAAAGATAAAATAAPRGAPPGHAFLRSLEWLRARGACWGT